jgi:hypothetical protein
LYALPMVRAAFGRSFDFVFVNQHQKIAACGSSYGAVNFDP